jgi:hypothetical protein
MTRTIPSRTRWILLCVWATACASEDRPETLADLGGYDGGIEIRMRVGEQERILSGSLTFDRSAGRLRFEGTADGRALVLVRSEGGVPEQELADGERVPMAPSEEGTLAVLLSLIHAEPDRDAVVERLDNGYRVRAGGQVLEVRWAKSGPRPR